MSEQDDQIEPLQQSEPDSAFKKFKNLGRAPDLLTEELYAFDRIAYEVEVSQLIKKAVLRPVNEHDAVQRKKSLSTKWSGHGVVHAVAISHTILDSQDWWPGSSGGLRRSKACFHHLPLQM